MLFQPFALAIVNDLFDEDLDPDLFLDVPGGTGAELTAGEADGPLVGSRPAQLAQPFPGTDGARPRRLS